MQSGFDGLEGSASTVGHQRLWSWRGWRIRYSFYDAPGAADHPPILLLHGFGANLNQWRHNLVPLGQYCPVYALDLLGFGGSVKAATLYDSYIWADQVRDFCRTVIGGPVILLGHSLGALVALTAVSQTPAIASGLVMITVPLAREDLVAGWVATLARSVESVTATPLLMRPLFYGIRRPSVLKRALKGIYRRPERVDAELLATFAHPPRERGAARALCYLVRSRTQANYSPSTRAMIRGLQIPALLLWGDCDRVIPYSWAQSIADLSDQITLKTIAGGGHCCYDEQPEIANPMILDWLAAHWDAADS